jgi:ABC-type lipoprotein release transport system permease subunit
MMIEAGMIGVIGILLGSTLGYIIITITGAVGIDLSILLGSTSRFYVDPLIYPYLKLDHLGITASTIFLASILSSLYPAWRASLLQPVEAIRNG